MSDKVPFELEFEIKSSINILFNMISTPSGLSEWFSDNVNIKKDVYSFIWDGSEEKARLISKKKSDFIRFKWLNDEEEGYDTFFEIKIKVEELTNDVALIIKDFAYEDEVEEAKLLWENQVSDLKKIIGS